MAATDPTRQLRALQWTLALSLAAAYLGDRWGMLAGGHRDALEGLMETDPVVVLLDVLVDPIRLSADATPALCALALFTLTWGIYAFVVDGRTSVRRGDEYGSARRGTVREALVYKDVRDPDNNVVLTKNLGIAIRNTDAVRQALTARNVCVLGGTGSNKTTGFVMPNILCRTANC